MPRKVKSGLIQMSLPMTEGEGSIQEIMDAMIDKHIPYIEEAGKKEYRFFACKRYSIPPIFVQDKIENGMNLRSRSPDQQLPECRNTLRNTRW